jgi:hypothetical protein
MHVHILIKFDTKIFVIIKFVVLINKMKSQKYLTLPLITRVQPTISLPPLLPLPLIFSYLSNVK